MTVCEHRCYKHRVRLASSSCSPALCLLRTGSINRVQQLDPRCYGGDRSLRTQQHLITCCFASLLPFCPIAFPATRHQMGAAFNQSGLARLLSRLSSSLGWSKRAGWMAERRCGPSWSQSKTPAFFSNDEDGISAISSTCSSNKTGIKNQNTVKPFASCATWTKLVLTLLSHVHQLLL